ALQGIEPFLGFLRVDIGLFCHGFVLWPGLLLFPRQGHCCAPPVTGNWQVDREIASKRAGEF
ncbi:MAG: hypothetical protein ABFS02_12485, partial [Pseudomonadota bacterium]